MKGSQLTSIFLASLLTFSISAVAQQSSPTEPNSGIDSAQDVDPSTEEPVSEQPDKSNLDPDGGVNSAQDVDPTPESESGGQLEEDAMAPNSGIDSNADVSPDEDEMNN
ncbi:hypothetical protein SAMN02745148_00231 [Modicisalibacter ilicicola DSM 19980]|uniref:Uncharacterized protein n=1 Tax=Modicisalibacter ilicicola DSM 19980 TaxID=1121942 RepID=A0A1M4SUG6_9GAMM|nr:hypothetical protein [Halomonas ilicicola]SHE35829.1 hypothetical protein SAMN02745148_00231 [Halomonas ilicicola DSM 19980]